MRGNMKNFVFVNGYVKNMRREYFKAFASKCKVYGGMEKRCQQMQKLCSEI